MEKSNKKKDSNNSHGNEIIGTLIFTGIIILLMWAVSHWM